MIRWMGAIVLVAGGCAPSWHARRTDARVEPLLTKFQDQTLGGREEWLIQAEEPAPRAPPPGEEAAPEPGEPPPAQPLTLDLETALHLAAEGNRDYKTQRETLYLAGLSFTLTRFDFGPQLRSTVATVWNESSVNPSSRAVSGTLGVSQILPTGGVLSLDSALAADSVRGQDRRYSSTAALNLAQPLLRGAGREVSYEPLTQSERDLVYAVRDYELFRQDFTIAIASTFFDLVTAKKSLANQRQRHADALYDLEKAQALRAVDRNSDEDVFRAQRDENTAKNDLVQEEADYQRSVDRFKIDLGLDPEAVIEIVEDAPPYEIVAFEPASAVQAALHNRLDVLTRRDQLEDLERGLRIARNGLLPDAQLDLRLLKAETGDTPGAGLLDRDSPWDTFAGLSVELPLQRTIEAGAYRAAIIALERGRRDFERFLDDLANEIEDALRQIQRTEQQIDLQLERIEHDTEAVFVTELRHEAGDVDNRELLDTRQALTDAHNELNRLYAEHFIRSLQLYRDLGILFVDEKGMWHR